MYSMTAFARDLGLSSAFFNQIINKKRNLSIKKAMPVIDGLKWEKNQNDHFIKLVQLEQAVGTPLEPQLKK